MTSFISSFRPLLLALMIVVTTEFVGHKLPIPQRYNTDLLTLAPHQKERTTTIFLTAKVNHLGNIAGRFIQVGDSSGFFGIRPAAVVAELDGDGAWLNFSCCARTGFAGYRIYADEILSRQEKIGNKPQYVVLAITPYYLPTAEFEDSPLAQKVSQQFAQPWRYSSPYAGWRVLFTNVLYRGSWRNELLDSRIRKYGGKRFSEIRKNLESVTNLGWMERPGRTRKLKPEFCSFPMEDDSTRLRFLQDPISLFSRVMGELAEFARRRNTKLIVIFNPVPCSDGDEPSVQSAKKDVAEFRANNPDVVIPFGLIRQYPIELFKDKWHLSAKGAEQNSREIGRALRALGL